MARVLTMRETIVNGEERTAYLAGVQRHQQSARAVDVHFWVFERDGEPGRFIEFTEGPDADAIVQFNGAPLHTPLWREVQGY